MRLIAVFNGAASTKHIAGLTKTLSKTVL